MHSLNGFIKHKSTKATQTYPSYFDSKKSAKNVEKINLYYEWSRNILKCSQVWEIVELEAASVLLIFNN